MADLLGRFNAYLLAFYSPLGATMTHVELDGDVLRASVTVSGYLPDSDEKRLPAGVMLSRYQITGGRWSVDLWAPVDVADEVAK